MSWLEEVRIRTKEMQIITDYSVIWILIWREYNMFDKFWFFLSLLLKAQLKNGGFQISTGFPSCIINARTTES